MNQEILDWLLLLGRWVHITAAITWIGSSIFFMWLDRSFERNESADQSGHIGDLWMVHGGGFYHVEKLQMGPTEVPKNLHWFKWESYWTWMSGFFLLCLIFFTGSGTFLLDPQISAIDFATGLSLSLAAIFGSWFVYDFLWESALTKRNPSLGHLLTIVWVAAMSYFLCHQLSGRAAYMMVGAMMGTWMTANVFMRIIPRQVKMVEAAKRGEVVNEEWSKNAKNRSTHNTYFTLPIIFIMLSNHFPSTYGHPLNWLVLLVLCAGGALIREFFVLRLLKPRRAIFFASMGALFILSAMVLTKPAPEEEMIETPVSAVEAPSEITAEEPSHSLPPVTTVPNPPTPKETAGFGPTNLNALPFNISGTVSFTGTPPDKRKLALPQGCAKPGQVAYSNEVLIENSNVQNVLVRVVKGHEALPVGEVPENAVEVNQKGCLYEPRIVIARVNQEVVFVNSDPVFHNVRSFAKDNPNFNLAMPLKGQRIKKRFSKPEIHLETKCSVHPWMGGHIAVTDHPYLALTDKDGRFEIKGLPPGRYELEFWHEVFGTVTQDITVDGSHTTFNFAYKE